MTQCTLGVGCDEYGVCYAAAHGKPDECPCEEPRSALAPCPHCFESSGYAGRIHSATWYEPAWEDSDPTRPCPFCEATGWVESEPVTLEDLEEMAAEEDEVKL